MKTKENIRDWLLDNAVDEDGDLMLDHLDFSDFDGSVYINSMKVKYDLYQHEQKVQVDLYQYGHEVQGDLTQSYQKTKGDLFNHNNKYGGELYEEPSRRLLKEVTVEQLAKLGYKLKEKTK